MNAQLADISESFRFNAERAQKIVSKAGDERIALRPRPDSWSAAECLGHLAISTETFLPAWKAILVGGPQGNGPYKMDLLGKMLTWVLEPPARVRVKAPANLQPAATGQELARFLASQDQLLEVVSATDGLALDRIKVPSPANARIRYNVWSSFRVTDAHQRRHLLQAERAAGLSE
jgi:hypothetical protein